MDKNYFAHGSRELVIGGKLTFLPGAVVEGIEELFGEDVPTGVELEYEQPAVADSEATTIAALRADFNTLLAALRTAGVLAMPGDLE